MSVVAALVTRAREVPLTQAIRRLAELQVLDTVAVLAAGREHPLAAKLARILPGHTLLETIEADATLAHADEFDVLHPAAGVCPGALVVPAALALGAELDVPGARLIEAVVRGYDVLIEAALSFGGSGLYARGWWPSAVFGAMGSAMAAATLLDLDAGQTAAAVALAAAPLGGLLAADRFGDSHYLMLGRAAARGVRAAFEAQAGMTTSTRLLDEPAAAALGRAAQPTGRPGSHLAEVAFKFWPCARPLQAALAALGVLRDRGVPLAEATDVELSLPAAAARIVNLRREPESPADAAASAVVAVAGASAGRDHDPAWYRDAGGGKPVTGPRVRLCQDPRLDARCPAQWGATVRVKGTGIDEWSTVDDAPGAAPLSEQDEARVLRKAHRLLGPEARTWLGIGAARSGSARWC
ncbi:MmgE/PrpD family protein [Amycolatopsis sp. GM8]|uniref:MmgE/PrpD family protein n=1 Tax=Amycolatopsis sp. GM8 TaxID=2896530 RepID=UPI001F1F8147|nr:MmgE/PrpD family protein [Amycolatopsis sp. GM8]